MVGRFRGWCQCLWGHREKSWRRLFFRLIVLALKPMICFRNYGIWRFWGVRIRNICAPEILTLIEISLPQDSSVLGDGHRYNTRRVYICRRSTERLWLVCMMTGRMTASATPTAAVDNGGTSIFNAVEVEICWSPSTKPLSTMGESRVDCCQTHSLVERMS